MLNFHESPEKIIGLLKIISDYDSNLEKNYIIHKGIVSLYIYIFFLEQKLYIQYNYIIIYTKYI